METFIAWLIGNADNTTPITTLYHIKVDGYRITPKPLTLSIITMLYGEVKDLERTGHILEPVGE